MEQKQSALTITFGDRAENHKGMQIVGEWAENGFSKEDLVRVKNFMESKGSVCELICLNEALGSLRNTAEPAYVLVIREGVDALLKDYQLSSEMLFEELQCLDWDKKA